MYTLFYIFSVSFLTIILLLYPNCATARDLQLSPLHKAAYANDTISLKKWISSGQDLNKISKGGFTALHIAAYEGNKESVSMLIQAGANANLKDAKQRTALDLAFAQKHLGVAGLLIPVTEQTKMEPSPAEAANAPAN